MLNCTQNSDIVLESRKRIRRFWTGIKFSITNTKWEGPADSGRWNVPSEELPKVYNWISKIKGIQLDEIFGNARLSGSRQRKTKLQMDVSKIEKHTDDINNTTPATTPSNTPRTTLINLLSTKHCIHELIG